MASVLITGGCALHNNPRPFYQRQNGGYGLTSIQQKRDSAQRKLQAKPLAKSMPDACTSNGCALTQKALAYKGVPYKWGGTTRMGMDCSGLINRVFMDVLSIKLPHNSSELFQMGNSVTRKKLKKGDLVFFGNFMRINHTGIYMGDGKFIHSSSKKGVSVTALDGPYFGKRYKGARRLVE